MSGLKTVNDWSRDEVLAAVRAVPVAQDFVWDGADEDERPASVEELRAAVKKRGRPVGSGGKVQVAVRFDREVVESFRASGKGWQTRMNAALKDWLRHHSPDQAA